MVCYSYRAFDARGRPMKIYRSVVRLDEALGVPGLVDLFKTYWTDQGEAPPGACSIRARIIPEPKWRKLRGMGWIDITGSANAQ